MDSTHSRSSLTSAKVRHEAPFEELPNLPQPLIPQIDLNIQRMDISAMLQYRPSIVLNRKVGYSVRDQYTQTEETEIMDVHQGIDVLQVLLQDTGKLRRDFNFAKHILRANYEHQIKDRSTELYCRINEKMHEIERQNKQKMTQIRKSYQTQLDDAIRRISGDYKIYCDDILQGKTGHHDAIIEDLRKEVSEKDLGLRQQGVQIENLQTQLREYGAQRSRKSSTTTPLPIGGISQEEADILYNQIDELQNEVDSMKMDLATCEDENKKLKRHFDRANKQLEDEKQKYNQLTKDVDSFKNKVKSDQDKATKMADNRMAVLEKEAKEKVEAAANESLQRAQEQADMQQMKDRARFQDEIEKRKTTEDQLRQQTKPETVTPGEKEVQDLTRKVKEQKLEISRLNKDLERLNKVWELKMAVMKKNFHALKNELHLRHILERQSAHLHHATIGYASSGKHENSQEEVKKLLVKLKEGSSNGDTSTTQTFPSPKNVHFDDTKPQTTPPAAATTVQA